MKKFFQPLLKIVCFSSLGRLVKKIFLLTPSTYQLMFLEGVSQYILCLIKTVSTWLFHKAWNKICINAKSGGGKQIIFKKWSNVRDMIYVMWFAEV